MKYRKILRVFSNVFVIDSAIVWTLFNRLFSVLKGPITLLFLIMYLSPQEQGLWFSFLNLAALSLMAELGFTNIIMQFVSHEFVNIQYKNSYIYGDDENVEKIIGLIKYSIKVYLIFIPIIICILLIIGFVYYKQYKNVYYSWVVFSIYSGLFLFSSLLQSVYQGFDKVKEIQQNKLIGLVLMAALSWVFLFLNFRLWALSLGSILGLVIMFIDLFTKCPNFWKQILQYKTTKKFQFNRYFLKLQLQYAISWVSGFAIFKLYVPAVLKIEDEVTAGKLGLTLSLANILVFVSTSWLESRIPKLNMYVAKRERKKLNLLFLRSCLQGMFIFILGFVAEILGVFYIFKIDFHSSRFLDIKSTFLCLLFQMPILLISFMAIFLRAHKEEPFYIISLANALFICMLIFLVTPVWGLRGLLITTNLVYWFLILPWSIFVFKKKRNEYEKR